MSVEDLYLILEDASSYESGGVANLVDVVEDVDEYIVDHINFMLKPRLTKLNWGSLNALLKYRVVRVEDLIGNGDILRATKIAPSLATWIAGEKLHNAIKALIKGGGDAIEGDAKKELREKVEKIFNNIVEGYAK